jgi:beta-galactosidase
MYFGADYYPEHWPEERWSLDAAMMKEAHINIVRLAEFAWAKLEPVEGEYDFHWLDRAIEVLAKEGIRVIMGTPTATPPKWLMDKFSEIFPVSSTGQAYGFGVRRHYCWNNEIYRKYTADIVEKMVEHYKNNSNIAAWQIDNEFGGQCYCESCLKAFRKWLENKYGTLGKLNNEWGTIFWSQTYNQWEEVILPKAYSNQESLMHHNPGLLLDYYRFNSDSIVEYQRLQAEIIRGRTSSPVTHNFMGHYSELDYFNLGKELDFVSWDNYPNTQWGKSSFTNTAMAHDLMRGIKQKNTWIMEQQSGPCGWLATGDTPEPGQLRLWTYQAVAHGAEAIVYFRWRACAFGREQYWFGILDHDGIPRRRYREIGQTGKELRKLSDLIVESEIRSEVAMIKSYDNLWSHRIYPHNNEFDYNKLLVSYYDALIENNINTDITSIERDLNRYKLVIMPAFNLMTEELKAKVEEYVRSGGMLVLSFRSGTRTWNNSMTTLTLPGHFSEVAGVELEEFDSLNFGRKVNITGGFIEGEASIWCDILKTKDAGVLASYSGSFYEGDPAITVNSYGKGKVFYIGCDLNKEAMDKLMHFILKEADIRPVLDEKIPGVEAVKKFKDGKEYYIILNHNSDTVKIPFKGEYTELLSGNTIINEIYLAKYEVAVLQENLLKMQED